MCLCVKYLHFFLRTLFFLKFCSLTFFFASWFTCCLFLNALLIFPNFCKKNCAESTFNTHFLSFWHRFLHWNVDFAWVVCFWICVWILEIWTLCLFVCINHRKREREVLLLMVVNITVDSLDVINNLPWFHFITKY